MGSIIVLLLVLLTVPVHLHAQATTTLRGGRGELTISCLFVRVRFYLRIHCLETPQLSIEFLDRDGKRRSLTHLLERTKKNKPKWPQAMLQTVHIKRVTLCVTLGVEGCPATTALLCGAVASAADEALAAVIPAADVHTHVMPVWEQTVFRVNLEGIISLRLAKVIKERITLKGD